MAVTTQIVKKLVEAVKRTAMPALGDTKEIKLPDDRDAFVRITHQNFYGYGRFFYHAGRGGYRPRGVSFAYKQQREPKLNQIEERALEYFLSTEKKSIYGSKNEAYNAFLKDLERTLEKTINR